MAYLQRTVQILSGVNVLDMGRLDPIPWLTLLATNMPRGTYGEALADTDGTKARLPFEMLPFLFPSVDWNQEAREVVDEMIEKVYRPWVSTKAEGLLQTALNNTDGRSVLADMSVYRQGAKRRGARYISDDPITVMGLVRARQQMWLRSASNLRDTAVMGWTRQPELQEAIMRGLVQTSQEGLNIILPGYTVQAPPAALPTGNGNS